MFGKNCVGLVGWYPNLWQVAMLVAIGICPMLIAIVNKPLNVAMIHRKNCDFLSHARGVLLGKALPFGMFSLSTSLWIQFRCQNN